MSEYHKIETLYERDPETHKLKQPLVLKNRIYREIRTWHFTEKIDGTNIRCIWKDGKLTFGGKSDNAQIHADLIKWLYENVSTAILDELFPEKDVILYGEGYGAGIQKGGDYSPEKKLIIFDVFVIDTENTKLGGWWLSRENICNVASKLELDVVPDIGMYTLEQMAEMVKAGFPSRLNDGKRQAEGVVGKTVEALFDKKGHRLIVKLKTKDF